MRKILFPILCAILLVCAAVTTNAAVIVLDQTSPEYVGLYHPPEPAGQNDEVAYIANLITLAPGAPNTAINVPLAGQIYNREGSGIATASLPGNPTFGTKNETGSFSGINVSGYTYLMAKYDGPNGLALVWLVSGIGAGDTVTVPKSAPAGYKGGISHYTLFNADEGGPSPDGGMTVMLLSGVLFGVEVLRRRFAR